MKIVLFVLIAGMIALTTGCSAIEKEKRTYKQAETDVKKPVNCSTAEGDIRALEGEKAYAGKMIGAGVLAVVPISLIEGLVTGTEGKRIKIATGDYDKKLDEKIKQIKSECGI